MASKKPSSTPFQMPLRLGVVRASVIDEAHLDFATGKDIQAVKKWSVSPRLEKHPEMKYRAKEACDLAQLAAKRWRYYRDSRTFATSFEHLQELIAADPQGEFSFHLKVTAKWFPEIMGAAMIRRTWCHHIMIDFLFVHPDISGRLLPIKTVGMQMLQAISFFARELGCKCVWGEATLDSAPFYQYQLGVKVEDHFFIGKRQLHTLAMGLNLDPKLGLKLPVS
jgi:hypothetical protein